MSKINIVIPMAGRGSRFAEAGYTFPKPLIDIHGKTMIEIVAENLKPQSEHSFTFICQKEHYEKYDLFHVLKQVSADKFHIVQLRGLTGGAACTVLMATQQINNDDELIIANSDQYIAEDINAFVREARESDCDGMIMTFKASHPKWSYARTDAEGNVTEVAEKRVISENATVGIYYFKRGSDFVRAAQSMIQKNIRHNGEFYVCPVFNELLLERKVIRIKEIPAEHMHGLGTPEDLASFLQKIEKEEISL